MEKQKLDFLTAKARKLRDDAIEIIGHFGVGHIGGTMSVMDAACTVREAVTSEEACPLLTCWRCCIPSIWMSTPKIPNVPTGTVLC